MTDATACSDGARQVGGQVYRRLLRHGPLHRMLGAVLLVALGGGGTACSLDGLLNSDQLPADVSDPALTQTPQGARAAYVGTVAQFRVAFGGFPPNSISFVAQSGLLSDELLFWTLSFRAMDLRILPEGEGTSGVYSALQKVRGQAGQAIGLLTHYVPEAPALTGHLYALQGYAEIFLAELFCSGIPLSTLDYDGDFTYKPGSSTAAVFTHAIALFDTALTLAADSARFADLARMGRGRALLALGQYADAAVAVAAVADAYRYEVRYNNTTSGSAAAQNFARTLTNVAWEYRVPDREGFNGLDWRSSGDPRTRTSLVSTSGGATISHPDKYARDGSSPIVVASGVEARLIEAEAALQANADDGGWLATLNALRTDGTQDGSGGYNPGTGGVAGLAPLADPIDAEGRINLLFRERAFWLWLTGHRQGDLRRLIRQYGRTQGELYPVGPHPTDGFNDGSVIPAYGSDVTVPIPASERTINPLYTGCISRGA